MRTTAKLWILLALLVILSPVGLILPKALKAGAAWGEWSTDEIGKLVGYIPRGFERLSSLWRAPIPDYAFTAWEGKPVTYQGAAYVASAIIGIGLTAAAAFIIGRSLAKKE